MGLSERLIIASRKVLSDWDKNVTGKMPVYIEELRQAVAELDQQLEHHEREE